MSWLFSQALAVEYSAGKFSDGEPSQGPWKRAGSESGGDGMENFDAGVDGMNEIGFYLSVIVVAVVLHVALRALDGAVEGYMMRHLKSKEK